MSGRFARGLVQTASCVVLKDVYINCRSAGFEIRAVCVKKHLVRVKGSLDQSVSMLLEVMNVYLHTFLILGFEPKLGDPANTVRTIIYSRGYSIAVGPKLRIDVP